MTPRTAAVKDGRRSAAAPRSTLARPRLDRREHGVMLNGSREIQSRTTNQSNGCYETELRQL